MHRIEHELLWPGPKLFPYKLPTLAPDGSMRLLLAYHHNGMTPATHRHPVLHIMVVLNSKTQSHFFSNFLHKMAVLSDTFGR